MIDEKFYDSATWLAGAWTDDWVRALPPAYWKVMLDSVLQDFATWVPDDERSQYLASASGKNQVCEQLYLRLSQASASFIPWVSERIDLAGLRVLEIGCGSGSSTAAIVRAGAMVTGIDISEQYLRINRTRLEALGLQADLQFIPDTWLTSASTALRQINDGLRHGPYDVVVCYALLEHLLPAERLALLGALGEYLKQNPRACLVIFETPNRFAPYDWHSTQIGFPDVMPDELAQAYLAKRLPARHPWRDQVGYFNTSNGYANWCRGGRGVSFHEFDIAIGLDNLEVIQDGYSDRCDYIRHFRPDLEFEKALEHVFAGLQPPVPRGFCRPSLDVILRWREGDPITGGN